MTLTLPHLEHLISIREAAQMLGLSERRLRELVQEGSIRAAILPGGEIGVSKDLATITVLNEKLKSIRPTDYKNLRGVPITTSDAVGKYKVVKQTLLRWTRQGFVKVLKPGYRLELDEADVAYCAMIFHLRQNAGVFAGAPLLDENGAPYLLKHPVLSASRRRQR